MAVRPTEALTIIPQYNLNPYDEATNPYGFDDGGHIYNHLPSFRYVVQIENYLTELVSEVEETIAGIDDMAAATAADRVATGEDRAAAAASATLAAEAGLRLSGTSTTSRTPAIGSLQFTTQAGKAFDIGTFLTVQSRGTMGRWAFGRVSAYSGTSVTVSVEAIGPVVTAGTDWNLVVSGARGIEGPQGNPGPLPAKAVAAEILAGTDDAKYVTPKAFRDTAGIYVMTSAAVPMGQALNFSRTLTGPSTFDAPSGAFAGASGTLFISQDSTGGRTATWNTFWDFGPDGPPTLSTGANVMDCVFYVVAPGAAKAICSFKAGA